GVASAVMLARAAGDWRIGVGFLVGFATIVAITVLTARGRNDAGEEGAAPLPDRALLRAALDATVEPAAITDRAGRLLAANAAYTDRCGRAAIPPALPGLDLYVEAVAAAGRTAWREGEADTQLGATRVHLRVTRAGVSDDHLLWRIGDGRG